MSTLRSVLRRIDHIECISGVTTFFAMAYAIVLAPMLMSQIGLQGTAIASAVCIACAVSNILQGLNSKLPIGLGPSVSLMLYFSHNIVTKKHVLWHQGLTLLLIAHVIILIANKYKIRQWIQKTIPCYLNTAITAGIGILICMVAINLAHMTSMDHHHTIWHHGHVIGFSLSLVLFLLISKRYPRVAFIVTVMLMAIGNQLIEPTPHAWFIWPHWPSTSLALANPFSLPWNKIISIITAIIIINLMDCSANLLALAQAAHCPKEGLQKRLDGAMNCIAVGSIIASLLGLTPMNAYFESIAGIKSGGKSGQTAIVIGLCFILAMVASPMIALIPHWAIGGCLFLMAAQTTINSLRALPWGTISYVPSVVLTVLMIPLSSIPNGIGVGFLCHSLLHIKKKLPQGTMILSIIFLTYFGLLWLT